METEEKKEVLNLRRNEAAYRAAEERIAANEEWDVFT